MVAVLHPTGPGQQIPIDRAVVLIGRSPECDAVIDFSTKISRMHCALVQVDTGYYIRDLGSMNGVWVGGERVEKEAKLTNGVEVAIGDVKFQYLENVQPAAKPARVVADRPGMPVLLDECVEVLEFDDVEMVEPTVSLRPADRSGLPLTGQQSAAHRTGSGGHRMPQLRPEVIEDVEIIDDDVVDLVEDVVVLEFNEEVDIIDDDVVEVIDIVEDVEVVEDVQIVPDEPRRSSQSRRLR